MTRSRNLTLALIVIAFAQLMVVLDTTIVNVALPSVQRALHFSATDLEWVVNGYALAFVGLLLLGGRAGDMYGRRRMFITGVLLCAAGSGGAIGLILGGIIVNYLSWRWVLFVNTPIALVLAVIAPRVLPAPEARTGRLHLPGALSVTSAMTLLVYGLSRAATHTWTDNLTVATLGLGAALLVLFLLIELRSRQPLMPLSIFANRNRSGAFALRMVAGSTTLAVLFFLSPIVQNVLGYSALQAGFAFLPLGVGVVITAQITSRLVG